VFIAGIGESAPPLRANVCEKLAWLGVTLDAVIPTNAELMIARHTLALAPPVSAWSSR